jgi:hypothetical protein
MACVRGKCPCWPQAEPFDAAEMDLLAIVREIMSEFSLQYFKLLWESLVTQSLTVRPRRRGYVLSTFVCGRTLLGRMRYDATRLHWLLNVGVCPNVVWFLGKKNFAFGWAGGRHHPGRPVQRNLVSPLWCWVPGYQMNNPTRETTHARGRDAIEDLLLSAGACPLYGGPNFRARGPTLTRQWLAWHARASRRAWAATVAMVPLQGPGTVE